KSDFIGGNEGITPEIMTPIEDGKVYSTQPFQIAVKVTNEGESQSDGSVCISGLNPKYFSGMANCECDSFSLEGKRRIEDEQLEGEEEILTFEGGEVMSGDLKNFAVSATTRYDYKTYGILQTCIKKEAYSKEGCQITPTKNIVKSASSGPVTISKVTQEIIPSDSETVTLILSIDIKNAAKGDVFDLEDNKEECKASQEGTQPSINVRLINAPGRGICDPVKLRDGEATARCMVDSVEASDESYESEITVELEYAYEIIDSNRFEVV
ncbi:MAG: hypothetical protein L6408_07045, partial [Nanoarchaeota archaeon]|nr:hypothetical protein [Nanoarchaeota archaeon]